MTRRLVFVSLLLSLCLSVSSAAARASVVRIGVIFDGPGQPNAKLAQVFQQEVLTLTHGEFEVRFPANKRVQADRTLPSVRHALDRLLADRTVDLILTLGPLASLEACRRLHLSKPVVAPFVIDTALADTPLHEETSGIKNLSYVAFPSRISKELQVFQRIVTFKHFAFLLDQTLSQALPDVRQTIQAIAQKQGLTVTFVPVGASANAALAATPANAEAVYLAPPFGLSSKKFDRLLAGLIKKKLPSFSLDGVPDVERGVLAGLAPQHDLQRLARRVALNVQRILLGADAGTLPVTFAHRETLSINMATARAIEVWPRWQLLTEATLLQNEQNGQQDGVPQLTFAGAIQEAITANLDLAIADQEVAKGIQEVRTAKSQLLPQVTIANKMNFINSDQARASAGFRREQTVLGEAGLSQSLYDDDTWANFRVEQHRQTGREHGREQVRLDIVLETARAYLNVLRTQTFERVQRDNLQRTRRNLAVARSRVGVGYAGSEEVYRWESEFATNQRELIHAQAQTAQARIALNRVRHRPLQEAFQTQEADLNDPVLLTSHDQLFGYIDDPWHFRVFGDFLVQEGLANAPELKQLLAQIEGQRRLITAARRSFWLPKGSLQSVITNLWHRGGSGKGFTFRDDDGTSLSSPSLNDTNWNIGLNFSIPLTTGGARQAELARAREELSRLYLDRKAVAERIAQRIRSALEEAGASYAGIDLARDAAQAAQHNRRLVSDQYTRGTIGIIDLIDAQTIAFQAEQAAANAVHEFLLDLMELERAMGNFDFFVTTDERTVWFERLQAFFAEAGIPVKKS